MQTVKYVGTSLLLCWSLMVAAEQSDFIDDPFATRQQVSPNPGKNQHQAENPCQLNKATEQAWTLADILDQALCHNPQTRQAWSNALYQAGQVGIAQAAYLPTITLNTAVSQSMNSASSSLQVTSISSTSGGSQQITRFTPVVSFNYLLYNFGGREAQLDSAQQTLNASNWTHDAVLQAVMFAAIQAYYQVFASQSAAESAIIAEQASQAAFLAAQTRHMVGTVAFVDELLAKTAWAQSQLTRQKTTGEARVATGTLANVLGLEADFHLAVAPPSLPKPDAQQQHYVQQLIAEAKTLRPDLAAAEATVKAAEATVKAAEAGHLPTLSLLGNYGYNHTSIPSDTQSWTLGMQVSVPIFTGFNVTYQIRSAKEQLAVTQANLDQLDQSVSLDVWKAYQLLNTAYESFNSSEALLASATQTEQVALGRYKAGAGIIIDVLNAQASLANARLQLIQAQYTWLTQKAQLAQALGRLDYAALPR